jgi:subtilase family serine protease
MRRLGLVAAILVACASLPSAVGAAPPGAPRAAVGEAPRTPAGAVRLGAEAPAAPLRLTVVLRSRDAEGLAERAAAVSDPTSPEFRRFLSPAEVRARYGPSDAARSEVVGWLKAHGLSVTSTAPTFLIDAAGPAHDVAAAFDVSLSRWRLPSGRVVRAPDRAPTMPADVASSVVGVDGLSDVVQRSDGAVISSAGPRRRAGALGSTTSCASGRAAGRTPADLARLYGFDRRSRAGLDGRGVTVALLELAGFSYPDLRTFSACFGGLHPGRVHIVPVDGGPVPIRDAPDGAVEVTSDIEVLLGLLPASHIEIYESSQLGYSDQLQRIADDDIAQVVSTSWGLCEASVLGLPGGSLVFSAEAMVFDQMALQGQSVVAASGDLGSSACASSAQGSAASSSLAVMDPASQPGVLGVGGTQLGSPGAASTQLVWNRSGPSGDGRGWSVSAIGSVQNSVSTGGISAAQAMPAYQRGVDRSGLSSGAPCGNVGGACREVPDVAALADGYAIYGTAGGFGGVGWTSVGGTSLAAPLWAAALALAVEANHGGLGRVNAGLYRIDAAVPWAFTDITKGDDALFSDANRSCTYGGVPNQPCYEATPGYDMASGIGAPNVGLLVGLLAGLPRASGAPAFTTDRLAAVQRGVPATRRVRAVGGTAPLRFALQAGALPPGLHLGATTGLLTGRPTTTGTYSFVLRVSDASRARRSDSLAYSLQVVS